MGIIKRQAFKSSWTSLLGVGISAFSALFVIPSLPQEVYGTTSITLGIASLLLPITLLGLNSTYLRFNEAYSQSEQEGVFRKFYFVHTCASLIFTVSFFFISDWFINRFYSSDYYSHEIGIYISIILFFMGQFTILSAYVTSKYRLNVIRLAELIFQKIGIPLLFVLYIYAELSIKQLLGLITALYFIRALSLIIFRYKSLNSNSILGGLIHYKNVKLKTSTIPYSIFALFAVVLHQAVIDIDTLMVGSLVGVKEAGIYKYAFYIALIIDLPRINLVSLLFPLISKFQNEGNMTKLNEIYKRSSNLLYTLGCIMLLFIIPNLDDFFMLIPNGQTFLNAKPIIIYIALAKLTNMLMGVNFEIIASSKKYYIMLVINFVALSVVIIANLLFIPILGAVGAALATLLVWIIYNLSAMFYLSYAYKLFPFSSNTLKISLIAIIAYSILSFCPVRFDSAFVNILCRVFLTLPFVYIFYLSKVSEDLNEQFYKISSILLLKKQ